MLQKKRGGDNKGEKRSVIVLGGMKKGRLTTGSNFFVSSKGGKRKFALKKKEDIVPIKMKEDTTNQETVAKAHFFAVKKMR